MVERTGRIREYHAANRQGIIVPDDKGPEVRFYRAVVTDQSVEPRAGYLVSFDAPAVRMNKKRQPVQDAATSVTVTDTSHPVEEKEPEGHKAKKALLSRARRRQLSPDRNLRPPWSGRGREEIESAHRPAAPRGGEGQEEKVTKSGADESKEKFEGGKVRERSSAVKKRLRVTRIRSKQKKDAMPRRYLRPLPVDIRNIISELSACAVSPALLLDKYVRSMPPAAQASSPEQSLIKNLAEQAQLGFLKDSFLAAYDLCWQNRAAWLGIRQRHLALLASLRKAGYGVISHIMQSTCPFGMISTHPTVLGNIGIELHRTYGYPLIPGRYLRLLMQGYVLAHREPSDFLPEERLKRIFGLDGNLGELIFMDAIPTRPPLLEAQDESVGGEQIYRFGSDQAEAPGQSGDLPAARSSSRLRIRKGAAFVFSLALRPGVDGSLLDCVDKLFQAALQDKGFVLRAQREGKGKQTAAAETGSPL